MNQILAPLDIYSEAKHIVVINTAFLGDLILTVPFLVTLRRKFPNAKISLVCKSGIGELFLKLKWVDSAIEVKKGSSKDYMNVANQINQQIPDFVFCVHRSVRSYLLSLKIKTPVRVGYWLGFNWFGYRKRIRRDVSLPESLRILQLLTSVDKSFAVFFSNECKKSDWNQKSEKGKLIEVPQWSAFPPFDLPKLSGNIDPGIFERLKKTASYSKLIAIFPGSVWNTKRWPVSYFGQLVQELQKRDYAILLMGGPGEEVYGEQIEKQVDKSEGIINLIAKTSVWESMLVIHHVDLVVANDSASAHLAAMLKKKIISFFGPTVLSFGYRPWGNNVIVLENIAIKCRPCGAHGPNVCPIKTHECMTSITVKSALDAISTCF